MRGKAQTQTKKKKKSKRKITYDETRAMFSQKAKRRIKDTKNKKEK